jgi:uncharacterized protein
VKGQLEYLVRLQETDTQLNRTKDDKARHPLELENAKRPFLTAQKVLEQVKDDLETVSKSKREKERDLQVQEEHIEKLKARQSDIKTNKEYQAYLHELETARQEKGHLEDDLLLQMEELDNLNRHLAEQVQSVNTAESEFQSRERELAQHVIQLDEAITKLEAERTGVLKEIEEKLLRDYERLTAIRKGLAVVPILHGSCSGCHMNIPPQLVAEVKLDEQIHACSNCRRILYWPQSAERKDRPVEVKPLSSQAEDH